MTTQERIAEVLTDCLGIDASDLQPDAGPEDIPEWDSLTALRMATSLEEEFEIKFSIADFGRMSCVAAIEELVRAKLAA